MLKQILTSLLIVCGCCTSLAAQTINIQLQTSPAANVNDAKQASPLPVSLFLLADNEKFSKAGYFSLEDNGRRTLGAAYVGKRSFILLPNVRRDIILQSSDARYLGIIGGYNTLKGKHWRRVIKLSDIARKNVIARFNSYGVQLRYTDKVAQTRSNFYFDGNFNYGLLSATSTGFNYSALNRARLDINSSFMLGQLGMGAGYQWMFNSWLQKASVGLGFYYTPIIKIKGDVVSNLDNPNNNTRGAFTINSNSEQIMLESRVNMFRFAKHFTTYVDFSLGMVFYNTRYERSSSSNVTLEKDSRNSDVIYKMGAGVAYDYSDKLSMSLGYEYNKPTEIKVQEITSTNATAMNSPTITLNNNMLAFKVRYLM